MVDPEAPPEPLDPDPLPVFVPEPEGVDCGWLAPAPLPVLWPLGVDEPAPPEAGGTRGAETTAGAGAVRTAVGATGAGATAAGALTAGAGRFASFSGGAALTAVSLARLTGLTSTPAAGVSRTA